MRLREDPVSLPASQLAASAGLLKALAGSSGVADRADPPHLFADASWVLAYLVVASTLAGYAVFFSIDADMSPTIADSFAHASPVVALLLSTVMLG